MVEMDPLTPPASKYWQDLVTEIWADGYVFEILSETEKELMIKSYETDEAWDPLLMAICESDYSDNFKVETQAVILKINRREDE